VFRLLKVKALPDVRAAIGGVGGEALGFSGAFIEDGFRRQSRPDLKLGARSPHADRQDVVLQRSPRTSSRS
jgi:hypothetical protein